MTKPVIILTTIFELITLLFRFGLGLESTRHTSSTIGKLTFGVRIHHGYIGLLLFIIAAFIKRKERAHSTHHQQMTQNASLNLHILKKNSLANILKIVGWALILSDMIHHLLLYLITGSADLDLVYPAN